MNCLDPQPIVQTIIQGSANPVRVRLLSGDSGDPFDLTSATEIVVVLKTTLTPGYLEKRLSAGQVVLDSAAGGRFHVVMNQVDTMSLFPGDAQDLEVRVTSAVGLNIVQILGCLNVKPSLFPTAP